VQFGRRTFESDEEASYEGGCEDAGVEEKAS
jgi:hypothetical protein